MYLDSMKAEFMVLKSSAMNELYAINLNIDRVRIEQCDQTKKLEDNFKNMRKEIVTKNTTIKLLSENHNRVTYFFIRVITKALLQKIKRM